MTTLDDYTGDHPGLYEVIDTGIAQIENAYQSPNWPDTINAETPVEDVTDLVIAPEGQGTLIEQLEQSYPDGVRVLRLETGETIRYWPLEAARLERKLFLCPSCGEDYVYDEEQGTCAHDYGDYSPEWGVMQDREICYSCYEGDTSAMSAITRLTSEPVDWDNGEPIGGVRQVKELVQYGDDIAYYTDAEENIEADDLPDWFREVFVKRVYTKTDGWRGYQDDEYRLVKLLDTWAPSMGRSSDVPWKDDLFDLNDAIRGGSFAPPVPVYFLVMPTSNVCAVGLELLVAEADKDEALAYIASLFPHLQVA